MTTVVPASGWPRSTFAPSEAMAFGGQVYVSGPLAPDGKACGIYVITPGKGPGEKTAIRGLRLRLPLDATFAFTPGGHLPIADEQEGSIRIIPNGLAE